MAYGVLVCWNVALVLEFLGRLLAGRKRRRLMPFRCMHCSCSLESADGVFLGSDGELRDYERSLPGDKVMCQRCSGCVHAHYTLCRFDPGGMEDGYSPD
jgi:hypothetical protein